MDKLREFAKAVNIWVEMNHFWIELSNLAEDSDEVGELYEYDKWLNDSKKKNKSIMGMHVAIEQAEEIARVLLDEAESNLKVQILKIIDDNYDKLFFGSEISRINSDNIDSYFERLYDYYDEIYAYQDKVQYDNFIEYFIKAYNDYNSRIDNTTI